MKKLMIISGLITAGLLIFLLTGAADRDYLIKKSLRQANLSYMKGEYGSALTTYGEGLAVNPEHPALLFNAAQTAYLLGEYEWAAMLYEQSPDNEDKFLNGGNAAIWLGDAADSDEEKLELYIYALQTYYEGILLYPRNIPLKYNYESLKEKINELISEMEQESENQESESQEQEGEESESDGQNSQENQDGSESNEESENVNESQSDDENQDMSEAYEQGDENDEPADIDQEAIERILQILESQEEQSLKNNQEVLTTDEGIYGW
jgi:hypothetical protein